MRSAILLFCLTLLVVVAAMINERMQPETFEVFGETTDQLMVVLRETEGVIRSDERLTPLGPGLASLPNGESFRAEIAAFNFLGDLHIRFVFDGKQAMRNLSPDEFERLKLTPEQALTLAVANIKRVYGPPATRPWAPFTILESKEDDLSSSYMLDREYWRTLASTHPTGVVVSVPRREGLLYAPVSDAKAITALREAGPILYAEASNMRISSALYLFRDDRWSIFQPPKPR
jgi:hypothetical protein